MYAAGLVGSSTSVTMSAATCSPRRSRNRLRPLTTLSPLSVDEITPRNCAVTNGSRTIVSRLLGGLVAPSRRVARSAASVAALSRSNPSGWRATLKPNPVCVSSPSSARLLTLDVAAVLPPALADAGRRRHGDLAPGVGVVGVVDADPGIGGEGQPLELLGELDLALGREVGERVVPQRLRGCAARRRARPDRPTRRRCRRRRCRAPRRGPRRRRSGRACRRRRTRSGRRG